MTMENCVLCSQEVQKGGYSSKVGGVVFHPLCSACHDLCSRDPDRVVNEHREVLERMLARSREALNAAWDPTGTAETPRSADPDESLRKRYVDAYRLVGSTVFIGNAIKVVGVVIAIVILLAVMVTTGGNNGPLAIWSLAAALVAGGVVGIFCFALGTLICAQGQALRACLDTAVNTSHLIAAEKIDTEMSHAAAA